ncbi:MAG: glycoside hydrolase family 2 protein [Bacillota bacterium]
MKKQLPRPEYPRPQFERECWFNLNGQWGFSFDDDNIGIKDRWYKKSNFNQAITVPFTYHSELSGVNDKDVHDIVWYSKNFDLPPTFGGKRVILHFGAVDYTADIWVNGEHLAMHEGGHTPFSVEITNVVKEKDNTIIVRAEDFCTDLELPRGKQYWKKSPDTINHNIFYTRTTGIWQTVWLEGVAETYLKKVWITTDIDKKKVCVEYEVDGSCKGVRMNVEIKLGDKVLVDDSLNMLNNRGKREFWLDQEITLDWNHQETWVWTPETPILFDIRFRLIRNGAELDEVYSYFGMRKVSVVDGVFMLNNRPYYQKMLLDQGYWEDSLLTAPSDEAFVKDIEMGKRMGFNGVRKHQKVEDPRFLYWADKMGFLVWGEMPSAYTYSRKYVKRMTTEWIEAIERDYNHPCIVVWTPLNESWGVDCIMNNSDEQAHSTSMYWLTKSIDQTRLVISNDGWDHTKSDLLTIHDYEWKKDILKERYCSIQNILKSRHSGRGMYAQGWSYQGEPVVVSEMGGISFEKGSWKGWGYSSAESEEDFILRYYHIVSAILESPKVQGFVYTQIADVEQEINGLMTFDRIPKADPDIIRLINEGKWKPEI